MRKLALIFGLLGLLSFGPVLAQEPSQIVLYLDRISSSAYSAELSFDHLLLHLDSDSLRLRPLLSSIRSADLIQRQVLLAEAEVAPGNCRSLALVVSVQMAVPAGSDSAGYSYQQEASIPLDLALRPGSSEAMFLSWEQVASADTARPFQTVFREVRKKLPPLTARAYVSNEGSGNLSILDLQAGEVVGCLRVGQGPRGLAVSQQNRLLYVANSQSNTVSVLDLQTQQLRAEINLDFGDEPQALCLSRDERKLFSANHGSNSVTVLDAERFTILSKVSVGTTPLDIAADPSGGWIYVVNSLSDDISVLDPETLQIAYTLQVGSYPVAIQFAGSQRSAYVANSRSGYVTQINTATIAVATQLNLSRGISDIAVDTFTGTLYCAFEDLNYVSAFRPDLNVELTQIPVDDGPRQIVFDPRGNLLYVCCAKSNSISVINKISGRVVRTIATGQSPYRVVFP